MGKRGLSTEEKAQKMIEIFHEHKKPFTLKQLEKLGSKKGLNAMKIKDLVQGLVDDNLIDSDKIGSSNYFWSFPSKQMVNKKAAVDQTCKDIEKLNTECTHLEERIVELRNERVESDERTEKLKELEALKLENTKLKARLEDAQDNDPIKIVEMQKKVAIAKKSCERWTDNTWTLIDYLKKKHGMAKSDIYRHMGLKDDFDYPEYKKPKAKRAKKN